MMPDMKLFLLLLLTSVFFSQVTGKRIAFTNCGTQEVKYVDVEPCVSEPCTFKRGTTVTGSGATVAARNATGARLSVTVKVFGRDFPYTGFDPDLCKLVRCPIVGGKEYVVTTKMDVPKWAPPVSTLMVF